MEIARDTYPPVGEFIEVEGARTHVLERGEGRPLVLLHGIGASAHAFRDGLFDSLAAGGYRTIAIDRPGHGWSERPAGMSGDPREQAAFFHETLRALDVQRPVLVGQSWGGSVAAAYALMHPENVAGIVFIAPYLEPGHELFAPLFDVAEARVVSDLALQTVSIPISEHVRRVFARLMFAPDPVPEGWLGDSILLSQTPHGLRISAADMRAINRALREMEPRYREIEAPVTLIVGLGDRIVDPLENVQLAEAMGWRLVALPHTGHAVDIVERDRVVGEIKLMMAWANAARRR